MSEEFPDVGRFNTVRKDVCRDHGSLMSSYVFVKITYVSSFIFQEASVKQRREDHDAGFKER